MKIYEIDNQIQDVFDNAEIDENTGEMLINQNLLALLEHQKEDKIEGLIAFYKNINGDILKFNAEIDNLSKRKKSLENKKESLENFLDFLHKGEKKTYGIHRILYRKSTVLIGDDISVLPDNFVVPVPSKPNKKAIKEALQEGKQFEGWALKENQNIQIK